jgi:uncharacterized repeat protein (TIGR01451 family)
LGAVDDAQSRRRPLKAAVVTTAATAATLSVVGSKLAAAGTAPAITTRRLFRSAISGGQHADLAVTKVVSDPHPKVGDTITYTVNVTNNGPDTATSVEVSDALPAGLSFVSAAPGQGTYDATTGLWSVGTLPVVFGLGQSLAIQAQVLPPSSGTPIAVTNSATVSHSDQIDANAANNTASVTILAQWASLSVSMSASATTVQVGDVVVFEIVAFNFGPDKAGLVTVHDLLPPGLSFAWYTSTKGVYDIEHADWYNIALDDGGGGLLRLAAQATATGDFTNTATITHSDQYDPSPFIHTASLTIHVS